MMKLKGSLSWLILGAFFLIASITNFIINLQGDGKVDWGTIVVFFIGVFGIYMFSKRNNRRKGGEETLAYLILCVSIFLTSIVYFIINFQKDGRFDWTMIAMVLFAALGIYLYSGKKDNREENKEE